MKRNILLALLVITFFVNIHVEAETSDLLHVDLNLDNQTKGKTLYVLFSRDQTEKVVVEYLPFSDPSESEESIIYSIVHPAPIVYVRDIITYKAEPGENIKDSYSFDVRNLKYTIWTSPEVDNGQDRRIIAEGYINDQKHFQDSSIIYEVIYANDTNTASFTVKLLQ